MIAGRLEIELMANVARLSQDMGQAKSMVSGAMADMSRSVGQFKSMLASLGVGLSVGFFANLVKGAIDAQAHMKELAQEAGTTASAISRFEAPAREAGLSTDAIAAAIFRMSKAVVEAKMPLSNAGQALKAIGLSTADFKDLKPDEIFEKTARALAKYGDSVEKNAIMRELFSKGGREMARAVEAIAEKTKLAATVTDEDAEAAHHLHVQMVELHMMSEKLWRGIATDLVPWLNEMVKAFIEGKKEAGLLGGAWAVALEAFGDPMKNRMSSIKAEIEKLQGLVQEGPGLLEKIVGVDMTPKLRQRIVELKNELAGLAAFPQSAAGAPGHADKPKPLPGFDPDGMRKALAEAQKLREDAARAELAADEMFAHDYAEAWKFADQFRTEEDKKDSKLRLEQAAAEQKAQEMFADDYVEAWKLANEFILAEEKKKNDEIQRNWGPVVDFVEGSLKGAWDAFTSGSENAAQAARRILKAGLFDWIYAQFGKPISLQFVATAAGALGFSGIASAAGAANGTSTLLSGAGAAAGFTGAGSSISGALFGTGVAAEGGSAAAGAGLLGSGGLGAGFAMGPVGWAALAVLAVAAVATAFRDRENWAGQLGFGTNAQAYVTQGVFGAEGFTHISGADATNRQIQTFMANTGAIDKIIAGTLSAATIAQITSNLAGPYATRNDGQPSEFAFGKDDATAGQQLTLEYLQKKYGTVFDTIDKTFADFIRGYTGKSEDLLKEIGAFVDIMQQLSGTGLKGFDVAALRAMARDGEQLGDTLKRVGGQWAWFTENFGTDAERLTAAQDLVTTAFATLGIAAPTSAEAFATLVRGLDLSTDAGRTMFTTLMDIAPAFRAVTNATAAAVATFNSLASSLSPGFGASNSRSVLEAAVKEWMGLSPGNSAGWSVESTIGNIGALVSSGNIGQALTYAQSLGGNAVDVLNRMLSAYQQWQQAMTQTTGNVGGLGGSVAAVTNIVDTFGAALENAKLGLREWIDKTMLNPSLSPLTLEQRFMEAQRQYTATLGLARGGDLSAMGSLGGVADTLLQLARSMLGSSANYTAFFRNVIGEVGGVAGLTQSDLNARLFQAIPTTGFMSQKTGEEILDGINDLVMLLGTGKAKIDSAEVVAAQQRVETAIQSGPKKGLLA